MRVASDREQRSQYFYPMQDQEMNNKNRQTILVVDDDNAHRTMLRTLVGGWGYDIVEADDG